MLCDIFFLFIQYLAVWGVEPVVTHQTSWLESTGECMSHAQAMIKCALLRWSLNDCSW